MVVDASKVCVCVHARACRQACVCGGGCISTYPSSSREGNRRMVMDASQVCVFVYVRTCVRVCVFVCVCVFANIYAIS